MAEERRIMTHYNWSSTRLPISPRAHCYCWTCWLRRKCLSLRSVCLSPCIVVFQFCCQSSLLLFYTVPVDKLRIHVYKSVMSAFPLPFALLLVVLCNNKETERQTISFSGFVQMYLLGVRLRKRVGVCSLPHFSLSLFLILLRNGPPLLYHSPSLSS